MDIEAHLLDGVEPSDIPLHGVNEQIERKVLPAVRVAAELEVKTKIGSLAGAVGLVSK